MLSTKHKQITRASSKLRKGCGPTRPFLRAWRGLLDVMEEEEEKRINKMDFEYTNAKDLAHMEYEFTPKSETRPLVWLPWFPWSPFSPTPTPRTTFGPFGGPTLATAIPPPPPQQPIAVVAVAPAPPVVAVVAAAPPAAPAPAPAPLQTLSPPTLLSTPYPIIPLHTHLPNPTPPPVDPEIDSLCRWFADLGLPLPPNTSSPHALPVSVVDPELDYSWTLFHFISLHTDLELGDPLGSTPAFEGAEPCEKKVGRPAMPTIEGWNWVMPEKREWCWVEEEEEEEL